MKRDLHLKKIYVATLLTALTILPASVAIGVLLENSTKSTGQVSQATLTMHEKTTISSENVCN